MILLYNHTGLPDKPVRDILTWAARKVGVKGDMAVKVNLGKWAVSGEAHRGWPYVDWLKCKPGRKRTRSTRTIATAGYYEIVLPVNGVDIIRTAIRFVEVALHESGHVYQSRNRIHFSYDAGHTRSGRRTAWAKRPEEVDAENREYEVLRIPANKRRADDLALALALAMEANQ